MGVFWGSFTQREPEENQKQLKQIFSWLAEGKLRPHVSGTYPLERGGEAISVLASRKAAGKLVIKPQE